jgi:hypothetical protein
VFAEKLWTLIPARQLIARHIQTLKEFPPRQRSESLSMQKTMDSLMQDLMKSSSGMQ